MTNEDIFDYTFFPLFARPVTYFSMEFAIDQSLKIYSGGLGFLAGSHLRSAYEMKQNLLGIGLLWKFGYYDQTRGEYGEMNTSFSQKHYSFLQDTGIVFSVEIHGATVFVKAYFLKPSTFGTAPLFLLTTDIDQNDAISRTITNKLYDANEATRIAQSIVLGIGGAKLMDIINRKTEIYHLNEAHALPLVFYLYAKYKSLEEVKKHVVFTTHTPEKAGNEEHSFDLLKEMSFFYHLQSHEVKHILGIQSDSLSYSLVALKFSKAANGVSKLHQKIANQIWANNEGIVEITSITNAQNKKYWKDEVLEAACLKNDNTALQVRKKQMKQQLFKIVANQAGKIFDENILTLVWARRFAGYKRADLMLLDFDKFMKLITQIKYPIQIIWAGKPYPQDTKAIETFNQLFWKTLPFANCAVLTGYELELSACLKKGSDVWLNNPIMYHEASGTSGMTAAMNGSINFSTPDGWIPEFAKHGQNCFLISPAERSLSVAEQNKLECLNLIQTLENEILPMYYDAPLQWQDLVKNAMKDIYPNFDSDRMAKEYYEKMYV